MLMPRDIRLPPVTMARTLRTIVCGIAINFDFGNGMMDDSATSKVSFHVDETKLCFAFATCFV